MLAANLLSTGTVSPAPAPAPGSRAYRRLYLAISLFFGLVMIFVTPVGQVPDEPAHFWRTYQLCRKHLIGEKGGEVSSGGHIPDALAMLAPITGRLIGNPERKLRLEEFQADWNLHVDRDPAKRIYADFHSYVVYSPVGYLPQMVGLKIGEMFSDRLYVLFYSARLANFLAAALITYLALRLAPCAHASICVLALCPTFFSQMCSVSADALTNSCALLFFALFLRAATRTTPLRIWDFLGMLAPLFVVTQMKFPYVGLALLLLALPVNVYGTRTRRWLACAAMGGACFAAYVGWYVLVRHLSMPGRPVPGISVPGQMAFILHHPWHFAGALFHALDVYGWSNVEQFVGVYGWLDTYMPGAFYVGYLLFFFATLTLEVLPPALSGPGPRFWTAMAAGCSLLTIFAFIYMYWNAVGSNDVEGFQGRYFFPLVLPLAVALNIRETRDERDLRPRLVFTGLVGTLVLLFAALTVATRFYRL